MEREPDNEHLLSVKEVAAHWGVHPKTVLRMIARNELPCVRIGRQVRIHPSDVAAHEKRETK